MSSDTTDNNALLRRGQSRMYAGLSGDPTACGGEETPDECTHMCSSSGGSHSTLGENHDRLDGDHDQRVPLIGCHESCVRAAPTAGSYYARSHAIATRLA